MSRLGNAVVTVVRAPLVSNRGGEYRDWTKATKKVVRGCDIQPFLLSEKLSFEVDIDREFSRTGKRFYLPPGTDVVSTDRLEHNGKTYEVFGGVGEWDSLADRPDHLALIGREYLG